MLDTTGIFRSTSTEFGLGSQLSVLEALETWKKFCDLPQEEKHRLQLRRFETDLSDPGYRRKRKERGYDDKELFHFVDATHYLLNSEGLHRKNISQEVSAFLRDAFVLHREFLALAFPGRKGPAIFCEDPHLNIKLYDEIALSQNVCTLRFLKYSVGAYGDEIASHHVDKSGLTIHLYSSHSGLEIADLDEDGVLRAWRSIDLKPEEFVVFGGHQVQSLCGGKIKPLVHRVVQPTMTEPRYSIVGFVPFISQPRFPKEKRIQEMMLELGYKL